jgi:hypothetical protein
MITSRKELANKLNNKNTVELSQISKKLNRIIKLWISRKEIIIKENIIIGNF